MQHSKLEWSEWCVSIKHAKPPSLAWKPKNSASVWLAWCLISSRIFKRVFICCYHRVSRKKRINLRIEKQQKSIDWLIGDPLIINTCTAQHLMGSAVWQQHKQYHLRLHCAECWQLLQNFLCGKRESQRYIGGHLSFFNLHGYIQVTFIHFWIPHPLSDCSPEWHSRFRICIVTQWCYWWWFSFSQALTKHGFMKYVIASVLHWSMIFHSTTSWWKIQGWRQGHFPSVVAYNMVLKLCLLWDATCPYERTDVDSVEGDPKTGTDLYDTGVVRELTGAVSYGFMNCPWH